MKLSVRAKMILLLFGSVVAFVIITLLMNTMLLKPYYRKMKEKALTDSFSTICRMDFNSDDIYTKIKSVEDNDNVQVLIIDYRRRVFFCSSTANDSLFLPVDDDDSGMTSGAQWFSDWLIPNDPDGEKYDTVEIFSTQPRFDTPYNSVLSASYLSLYAKSLISYKGADLPFYFIINVPLAAIEDGVQISNSFALLLGVAILIFGGIATFALGNRIVKPIVSINNTAKKISQYEFGEKLTVDSKDEIGELADSINTLSEQLEMKINQLSVANEQLKEDLLQKEKIDTMRRDFISDVSHELKTPLAIILGYCEGLQLNVNSDEREYYCSIIEDEALRMSRLTARLLNLAELESGENQVEMTEFSLGELAESRLEKLSYLLKERNIISEFSSEGDTLVFGDEERIEEVVINLLTNAKNHTPDSGRIKVTVREREKDVYCEVYNSGSFIPQESLERIWDSFYKVDKARTRAYGGSGLGLKIVSTILQSHDAGYGVENTDDGVKFWFALKKPSNEIINAGGEQNDK